jgi:hypothetical protein
VITLASATGAGAEFGVYVDPLDGGTANTLSWPGAPSAPGDFLADTLVEIQVVSSWSSSLASSPGGLAVGQSYTFVLTGDPMAEPLLTASGSANPLYDGRGVHIVAFPNSASPITY